MIVRCPTYFEAVKWARMECTSYKIPEPDRPDDEETDDLPLFCVRTFCVRTKIDLSLRQRLASGWISQGGRMSEPSSGWGRQFDEPIGLPDGRRLVLRDAASYITALPKKTGGRARIASRDRRAHASGRSRLISQP
jgi:hypothetical protein